MKKKSILFLTLIFVLRDIIISEENVSKNIIPNKKLIVAAWKASSRVSPNPIKFEYVFDKTFIQKLGVDKLSKIFKDIYSQTGSVINVSTISFTNEYYGEFFFHTEKEYIIPVTIGINPDGKITTFFIRPAFKKTLSTQDIIEKIKSLNYEKKGILIKKLTQIEDTLHSFNENEIFAIGSTFKLFILSYLAENEKRWDKVIKINQKDKSIPPGTLLNYPDQAPITIFTLAYHMISESDNTATDILIDHIGRQKLENYIKTFTPNYVLNIPFLKTSEAFKIKLKPSLAEKYAKISEDEKREIINSLSNEDIDILKIELSKPSFINSVEWFASPSDICKIMDHLRILNNPFVNAILSSNKGLDTKTGGYLWAGFKGGSEPGVLSLNWLLQAKDNRYYCISIMINDEKKTIDEKEIIKLSQDLLNIFGTE